jgi:hypothetical protein
MTSRKKSDRLFELLLPSPIGGGIAYYPPRLNFGPLERGKVYSTF